MAYTGKGINSQFLGIESGILKFLLVQAGGGLGVTVAALPVVADFETLSAAITANNSELNIIGDVAEVANVIVPESGLMVRIIRSAKVNMGANKFVWANDGDVYLRGGTLRHNFSINETFFDLNANNGKLYVENIRIENSGTGTVALMNSFNGEFNGVDFEGDTIVAGERNRLIGCDFTDLTIASSGLNNTISSSHIPVANPIVDNGSGTILSAIRVY